MVNINYLTLTMTSLGSYDILRAGHFVSYDFKDIATGYRDYSIEQIELGIKIKFSQSIIMLLHLIL